MISTGEFENLIAQSESSMLDFKKDMYDFLNNQDQRKTAEFVKDIIAFANTIRTESAFIIFGIKEEPDKSKVFHGLTSDIDDAILQNKVKDKVYPRPTFHYYTVTFNGTQFGVVEIPVAKYSIPVSPSVKMKGLEPGKIYYRLGTTNTEALGLEIIKINDWLRSLPEVATQPDKNDRIYELLKDLTANRKTLSAIIGEMYTVAKSYKLQELLNFCVAELQGISQHNRPEDIDVDYRIQNIFLSTSAVTINPYFNGNAYQLKQEFQNNPHIKERKMLISYPINKIEDMHMGYRNSDKTIAIIQSNWRQLYPEDQEDIPLNLYLFPDTVIKLLANIRQKAIDILMKL